ncbi:MAG: aminotransferase class V-fold PLP-dependent enzyme [Planctomycetes bacterium]|nr:aminotransferase class V-fold PLP-dependent enzyme [Planctomycetota bacterium]
MPDLVPNAVAAEFRRQMAIHQQWTYLDHAAVAPISQPAAEALSIWAKEASTVGASIWPQWGRKVEAMRHHAARLIGASPEEIALVPSTTAGISLVAEGFPWQPGDNVVAPADEFPSNQYPWMNLASRGVELRRVEMPVDRIDLDRLESVCDARTRIVSVSWVAYANGWRNDVAELAALAHRHGALLFLDAIQGLGAFPLDATAAGVDFLAADGHKWMLGPEGAGVFYVRREHLDRLRPLGVGWHSVRQGHDFTNIKLDFKPAAERYEGGSQNMPGMLGLGASIELLLSLGIDAIAQRILEVTDLACRRLGKVGAEIVSCREPKHASGIVSFDLPGRDLAEVRRSLVAENILLSHRAGRLRISPHGYNTAEDIEKLIDALAKFR